MSAAAEEPQKEPEDPRIEVLKKLTEAEREHVNASRQLHYATVRKETAKAALDEARAVARETLRDLL